MSQSSVAEEYCQTHGDLFVAFDKKRNELVCNQCIYAEVEDVEKAFEQLTFTSYVASNLKDLFDEKFNAYRQGLAQMNQIAPQQISQQLEHTVSHFFETVDNQIKEVEQSVLAKIQASTNLSELENLLMKEKNSFGIDFEKLYDNNRQEIEGFVQKGCYSSVVNKKDTYETLIKQMQANNESMSKVVCESQQKIEKIMTIKKENEANLVIGKRLHEIVDSCLEIDIRKDEIPHFKRQKTDAEENVLTQAQTHQIHNAQELARQRQLQENEFRRQQEIEAQRQHELARQRVEESAAKARAEQEERARQQAELQRAEQERIARERAEQERIARERAEQERIARERADQERIARERADQERIAQEKAEQDRVAQAERKAFEERHRMIQETLHKKQLEMAAEREKLRIEEAERQRVFAEQQAREEEELNRRRLEEQHRIEHERLIREEQANREREAEQARLIQEHEMNRQALLQQEQLIMQQKVAAAVEAERRLREQTELQEKMRAEMVEIHERQLAEQHANEHHEIVNQEHVLNEQCEQVHFVHMDHIDHCADEGHHMQIEDLQPQVEAQVHDIDHVMNENIVDQIPQIHEIQAVEQQAEPIVVEEAQAEPQPIEFPVGQYQNLFTQYAMSIWKHTIDTNLNFRKEQITSIQDANFMYKTISLPGNRVFVIGGSKDISGNNCTQQTLELVDGKFEQRAPMWLGRAAFGCAIYPNFSQIFIAGGRINQSEATRQCERYIVANNQWKRLPELREAKFSVSLCFFNNGSTLYCFGGIYQTSQNMMQTSNKIERLSKGQNSWQILDLKLPAPMMDLGAFQIENDEVMLYGGFNDGASKSVWFYRTAVGNEGEFYEGKELEDADFFTQNGVHLRLPNRQLIFPGHKYMHLFNPDVKAFRTLKTYE